jgi:hypothetical protein
MLANVMRAVMVLPALCLLLSPRDASAAGARNAAARGLIAASSPREVRGMRIRGMRSGAAASPGYTIRNIGAPSGYDFSSPSGFNNTGQIFGQAGHYLRTGGSTQDCFTWSANVFRRVPLPPPTTFGTGCSANAIADANPATGEYEVVGSAIERFAPDPHAYAAIAGPTGFKRATVYYAYAPSTMVGVNASQISLAAAEFDRDTAYDAQGLLYSTTTGAAGSLTPLQPLATGIGPALHVLAPTYQNPCPFGGCAINARNEVLGFDFLTINDVAATVALYTVGEPSSLVHLPLSDSVGYDGGPVPNASSFPVAFNDIDQLLYLDATLEAPALYDADTGVRTIIPVAAGPDCGLPVPLSLNNLGEVLGTFQYCATPIYYTWDPVHGTQYLNTQIPANAYTIYPLGVNDNGQILVKLTTSSSVTNWGTLDPVAASDAKPRRGRHVRQP